MVESDGIKRRCELLAPVMDERTRRLVAAAEALALGWGGATAVSKATGVSRRAIGEGVKELSQPRQATGRRVRREGGGCKKTVTKDTTLLVALERLVEPVTRGDPESPLRWTCKSMRKLAAELNGMGHGTSQHLVAQLLPRLGYSLQADRKTIWRGRPLVSHEVIVKLIAATTTKTGLSVRCQLDTNFSVADS